jgi:hypothetical protein
MLTITGLSCFAEYQIQRPDALISFDIATMLTPVGLLRHFLLGQTPELAPYYSVAVEGRQLLYLPTTGGFALALFATSLIGLYFLRRRAK